MIGLLAANAEVIGGRIGFKGADLLAMSKDALRRLRGDRITAVFQDPMTALNPVLSIGTQMADDPVPFRAEPPGEAAAQHRDARKGPHPRPGAAGCGTIRTSSPAACDSASASPWR